MIIPDDSPLAKAILAANAGDPDASVFIDVCSFGRRRGYVHHLRMTVDQWTRYVDGERGGTLDLTVANVPRRLTEPGRLLPGTD